MENIFRWQMVMKRAKELLGVIEADPFFRIRVL